MNAWSLTQIGLAAALTSAACARGGATADSIPPEASVPAETAVPEPATAVADAGEARASSPLQTDLEVMAAWFDGRFDNHLQVLIEQDEKVEDKLRHEHIHSIFARIDMPDLGPYVYYVQQSMGTNLNAVYRQRLYTLEADAQADAIVLKIYSLPDPKAVMHAHRDPSKLAGLTVGALKPNPGCEVYWTRSQDHFEGHTKKDTCHIKSERSGRTLVINDDLYLDEDEIWIKDRATDEAGNPVFGHPGGVPHKLRRARSFAGWGAVRVPSKDSKTKGRYTLAPNVELHDQGGRFELKNGDGNPLGYTVELAQMIYGRTNTPILKLGVYRTGEDKTIAYTWANPSAERIGVNLGEVQVGLHLEAPPSPTSSASAVTP